ESPAQAALDGGERLDAVLLGAAGALLLAPRLHLRVDLHVAGLEEAHHRRGDVAAGGGVDLAELAAAAEGVEEGSRVAAAARELEEFADHDRPRHQREEGEQGEDELPHRPALQEGIEDVLPAAAGAADRELRQVEEEGGGEEGGGGADHGAREGNTTTRGGAR